MSVPQRVHDIHLHVTPEHVINSYCGQIRTSVHVQIVIRLQTAQPCSVLVRTCCVIRISVVDTFVLIRLFNCWQAADVRAKTHTHDECICNSCDDLFVLYSKVSECHCSVEGSAGLWTAFVSRGGDVNLSPHYSCSCSGLGLCSFVCGRAHEPWLVWLVGLWLLLARL